VRRREGIRCKSGAVPATVIAFFAAHNESLGITWEDALTGKSQETCHFVCLISVLGTRMSEILTPALSPEREGDIVYLPCKGEYMGVSNGMYPTGDCFAYCM